MTTLPGPPPHPVFGLLGSGYLALRDPITAFGTRFDTYGPLVGLVGGDYDSPDARFRPVFCYGPELNQQVITQHDVYHKLPLTDQLFGEPDATTPERRRTLSRFMGGLFHINEDVHRQHRRLMMPAFHKKAIHAYRDDMVRLTEDLIAEWQPGRAFDLKREMRRLTMRIVVKTLFGETLKARGEQVGFELMDAMRITFTPYVFLLPYDVPGLPFHKLLTKVNVIDQTIREIIQQKRASGAQGDDLLSALIRSRDEDGTMLTEEELIGHAEVIFGAGHETSSTALMWTIILLTQHPEVMQQLYDELDSVLGGQPPTVDQLSDLVYLEWVLKESMRVIPPVPFNSRMVARPTELGGVPLDVGREVIVSIYHTHHDATYFDDPYRFAPERWAHIKPGPFTYNPFSAGPRMCIGAPYAMMELKIALAIILQRFRMEAIPGTRINRDAGITMDTKSRVPIIAHQQDRCFAQQVGGLRGDVRQMVTLPR